MCFCFVLFCFRRTGAVVALLLPSRASISLSLSLNLSLCFPVFFFLLVRGKKKKRMGGKRSIKNVCVGKKNSINGMRDGEQRKRRKKKEKKERTSLQSLHSSTFPAASPETSASPGPAARALTGEPPWPCSGPEGAGESSEEEDEEEEEESSFF